MGSRGVREGGRGVQAVGSIAEPHTEPGSSWRIPTPPEVSEHVAVVTQMLFFPAVQEKKKKRKKESGIRIIIIIIIIKRNR